MEISARLRKKSTTKNVHSYREDCLVALPHWHQQLCRVPFYKIEDLRHLT